MAWVEFINGATSIKQHLASYDGYVSSLTKTFNITSAGTASIKIGLTVLGTTATVTIKHNSTSLFSGSIGSTLTWKEFSRSVASGDTISIVATHVNTTSASSIVVY